MKNLTALKDIYSNLYEYKKLQNLNSVQFTFATKLANTIDGSEMIKLCKFNQPHYSNEKDSNINKYFE